jgi:predicted kinase
MSGQQWTETALPCVRPRQEADSPQAARLLGGPRADTFAPLATTPIPDTNPAAESILETTAPGRVLVAYRGLPGSGKTTHAEAQVTALRRAGTPSARVSRDDIRDSMRVTGGGKPAKPDRVTAVHHAVISRLFEHGIDVILVDDTHLDRKHLTATADLAHRLGATLHVIDLRSVSLTTCLTRDARRHPDQQVGAATITALANRHVPCTAENVHQASAPTTAPNSRATHRLAGAAESSAGRAM